YDKADQRFGYDDLTYDEDVDAMKYCIQAERLFELYQTCANRKQIETICLKFLRSLDAKRLVSTGISISCPGTPWSRWWYSRRSSRRSVGSTATIPHCLPTASTSSTTPSNATR